MTRMKKIIAIMLACTLTLSVILPVFAETYFSENKQEQKVSDELLEIMNVSYSDLLNDNFVDDGTAYSCIIWINDIDKEVAVRAGIDAAEKTRDTYTPSKKYKYPYTLEEVKGIKYVEVQLDENENDEYVQSYIEAARAASSELYQSQNNNFVAENFKTRDSEVNYISSYTPCVFADLTLSRIANLMNQEDVNRIGYWDDSLPENDAEDDKKLFVQQDLNILNSYLGSVRVDIAKQQYNVSGSGIKIGQYEPYCPNNSSVIRKSGCGTSNHASNVYTIMHTVAPNASYYAAGGDFEDGIEWLIDNGVNIINMSAGWDTILDTYDEHAIWTDHISYNHNVHFVNSSGNMSDNGVTSPGMAYNIITVGGAMVIGSPPYGRMAGSSYNNKTVSRLLQRTYKPDVIAPGEFQTGWGTSYSAPFVTGTIALLCQYRTLLKTKPRITKAILAASANYVTSDTDNFKEKGAGTINAKKALDIIADFSYDTNFVSSTVNHRIFNMNVQNSNVKRIALAYENSINIGSGIHENTVLNSIHFIAELKLEILDPSNNVVASCTYTGANLKVLEFVPQTTGTYKIKVTQVTANSSDNATYFGVAWM